MIPRIIHQTWKTDVVPTAFADYSRSWSEKNPGWKLVLWSDRMLLDFVAERYPHLLEMFCGYETGIRRADAGRYMLLHHFGGIYADLDTECLETVEPLVNEDRVVLSEEPPSHWSTPLGHRAPLKRLIFNGVLASPAGHPFWVSLLKALPPMQNAKDTLDATGPCLLSHVAQEYGEPETIVVHSCRFFNEFDTWGKPAKREPGDVTPSYARHHWAGTWYPRPQPVTAKSRVKTLLYKAIYKWTRGDVLDVGKTRGSVDKRAIAARPSLGDALTILVPVRDCADQIAPFLAAIGRLDHPKDRTKLIFCEGDSVDDSFSRLQTLTEPLKPFYRDIRIIQKPVGTHVPRHRRWRRDWQRARRSGLAKVRNYLIDEGVAADDDWALWIDIDVWKFPNDIVRTLRATGGRVIAPNCVKSAGGTTFDNNSFIQTEVKPDYRFYRQVQHGLYMPPSESWGRLYMSDLRYLDWVELDAVGGTMLLVDAALHRGGLRFPEAPYRFLIETEGFGALARDVGVVPIGLPKVEILHSPW